METMESKTHPKLRWWKEVLLIGIFYLVYSYIRNIFGTSTTAAFENAVYLIRFEESIGLYVEGNIQNWFLDNTSFIRFWNYFYGTAHFFVTIISFMWAYIRFPKDFPKIRNVGLWSTGLGLIIFATFPVMPPRLLNSVNKWGGSDLLGDTAFFSNFTDTIAEFGGFLTSAPSTLESVSNQYAAMPSIHIVWAIWCAFIIYPRVKNPIIKALAILYPLATLFTIIVTANHYWIDALGGVILFVLSYLAVYKLFPHFKKTPTGIAILTSLARLKARLKEGVKKTAAEVVGKKKVAEKAEEVVAEKMVEKADSEATLRQ